MEATLIVLKSTLILIKQLGVRLHPANLWTLCAMIALLLTGTPLHLYRLARAMPGHGEVESRAQKLRRWISHPTISPALFVESWLALLAPFLEQMGHITLIIDRTDWTKRGVHLNIFFCSLHGLFWTLVSRLLGSAPHPFMGATLWHASEPSRERPRRRRKRHPKDPP